MGDVEAVKAEANALYADSKYEEAIAKYTEAIKLMPELDPDDDDVIATLNGTPEGKLRAVLLSNRAQAFLQIGKMDPGGIESKEARKCFMKASMDAGLAVEIAPDYSKAQYRKGLALLGMPETPQRAKEAVGALEAALKCSDMTPALADEVKKMLQYAQERRFDGVDMPENCVVS
mmetsp:Transcript_13866/g.32599  ORF Transcript_13866/g.32599 Transcript_13866/m.32599 type:complete len:175 (+) Transcript_13866:79-603(+)